jgi:hypothetical protein
MVRSWEVPPVLKPVASDMDRSMWLPLAYGIDTLNVPPPLLSAVLGMEMFRGVSKTCGGCARQMRGKKAGGCRRAYGDDPEIVRRSPP